MNEVNISVVIQDIFRDRGIAIINNPKVFCSIIDDLVIDFQKERFVLRRVLCTNPDLCNKLYYLLSLDNDSLEPQLSKMRYELNEVYGVSEKWIDLILEALFPSRSKENISESITLFHAENQMDDSQDRNNESVGSFDDTKTIDPNSNEELSNPINSNSEITLDEMAGLDELYSQKQKYDLALFLLKDKKGVSTLLKRKECKEKIKEYESLINKSNLEGFSYWDFFVKNYNVGDKVAASIVLIHKIGYFVKLFPDVSGLILKTSVPVINYPAPRKVLLNINDIVSAKITKIDIEKKRVSLDFEMLLSKHNLAWRK